MSFTDRSASGRPNSGIARAGQGAIDQGLRSYMLGVYNYMTIGLGVTGLVAYGAFRMGTAPSDSGHLALTPFGQAIYVSPLHWLIVLSPLAIIMFFGARLNAMSAAAARNTFLIFAALIGLSMSALFVRFTGASIGRVFFETSAAFGALSLTGYVTKRDLSAFGSFLIMGLWGLIIASVINVFLQSTGMQWALSILCIGIFAGLTAYDTQNIKQAYLAGDGYELTQKKSIHGALMLYLDFVNIFQAMISLFGNSRD